MRSGFDASALADDTKTVRRLEINYRRNKKQDHTVLLDQGAADFDYADCRDQWWNAPEQSLLHGTPLWDGATEAQRILLNKLFWVAYYSQVVSAEVATIYFNQASATGLYGIEDLRLVADTLDLESSQERAHIAAFRTVAEAVEKELFGDRVFTWPMRGPFEPTMIFSDLKPFERQWRRIALRAFGLVSAGNAFLASQYLTVRGLRTLNGKMVQSELSGYHASAEVREDQPIPSKISYWHFMDESFHFNSSTIIGLDVVRSLPAPTRFERFVADEAIKGCQRDHGRVSVTVRGLFWEDSAAFGAVYRVLRSPAFGFDHGGALEMLQRCYGEENEAMHLAHDLHVSAAANYAKFVEPLPWLSRANRDMSIMRRTTMAGTLARNRAALERFAA